VISRSLQNATASKPALSPLGEAVAGDMLAMKRIRLHWANGSALGRRKPRLRRSAAHPLIRPVSGDDRGFYSLRPDRRAPFEPTGFQSARFLNDAAPIF
jgi:hypothetical protein